MAEAGVPGVVSATDYAIYAPGGTPESLQAEVADEFAKWGRVIAEAKINPE